MPDDRLGDVGETPAGDPRPHVEVDVLVEGEVALVIAAELAEQLTTQEARGATDAEDLVDARQPWRLCLPRPGLDAAPVGGQGLAGAVEAGAGGVAGRTLAPSLVLEDARLHAGERRIALERVKQQADAAGLELRVSIEREDSAGDDTGGAEVHRRRETDVARQREVRHAALLQQLNRAIAGAVVDDQELELDPLGSERVEAARQQSRRVPAGNYNGDGSKFAHAPEVSCPRCRGARRKRSESYATVSTAPSFHPRRPRSRGRWAEASDRF